MSTSSSAGVRVEGAPAPPNASGLPYSKLDFQVIYPQYIDACLTPKQGRRLTKQQAVCTPTVEEIILALQHLGYKKFIRESARSYPRSQSDAHFPIVPKECIRVAIKSPKSDYIKKSEFDTQEREIVVESIPNKMELLRRIAAHIKATNPTRPQQQSVEAIVDQFPKAIMPSIKTKQKIKYQ